MVFPGKRAGKRRNGTYGNLSQSCQNHALFRITGVNFILLSLLDRMGCDVSVLQNEFEAEIDRALFARFILNIEYEYVYVDLDDTIIVDDKVNTTLMKFLYQSKNFRQKNNFNN
ncbi:hypothetical protein WG906_05905 [Pedobacter sp. P351]|uniref:hypothetical protein n=1 Tax=Pedobacter superstes TaxID=3133441 RepID=UPI0030A4DE46